MAPNQTIPAGNRIPGTARSSLFAGLAWAPPTGWRAGVEVRAVSRVPVNDANSDAVADCAVAGANLAHVMRRGAWELRGFGRVDNAFGRNFAGWVIVNEGNARYFEPARADLAGRLVGRAELLRYRDGHRAATL